jgi:hypothetical protein
MSIRYFSQEYQRDRKTDVYVKFDEKSPIGFNFQTQSDLDLAVFDGSKYFYIDKEKRTIRLNNNPKIEYFNGSTFLVNSVPTLRKFLPHLIPRNEFAVTEFDTTIQNKKFSAAKFTLTDKMLHRFGYVIPLEVKKDITYTVVIDGDLPYMVVQHDNLNPKDYIAVTFTNMLVSAWT